MLHSLPAGGFLDDLGKELESGITGVAKSALEGVADVVKGFIGGLFGDKEAEAAERRHRWESAAAVRLLMKIY